MNPDLLKILRCPETHQPLKAAEISIIEKLNQKIDAGQLQSRAGNLINARIDAGLIRNDGKLLFPVRGELPILLMDEAIILD